jgi:GDP-4-dehydro-6-deoxy-D-mannose reductase
MRVLVTGAAGFVGPHLAEALRRLRSDLELIETGTVGSGTVEQLDVSDWHAVDSAIARHRPTHVVHLAGIAAPVAAARAPEVAWRVNLDGTLAIANSILANAPDCWLINAGSGLIYGDSNKAGLPLDEEALPAPVDTYGATKVAADLALGALAHGGLKCIRMRPFNHIGPGQSEAFALPSFAAQIARIEAGTSEPVIRVGNLTAERDILDVRDVARAYSLTVMKSEEIAPGTIINIASGRARRMADVLTMLLSLSPVEIRVEQDPSRMRAIDLSRVVGDAQRARDLLGWEPVLPLEKTLLDILNDQRERLAK